jgi:hypothetical protein
MRIMSKQEATDFSWHVVVGDREMSGTARSAVERESRRTGATDLMTRDPNAGTARRSD